MFGDDSFDRLVREFFGEHSGVARDSRQSSVSRDSSIYASNIAADYDRIEGAKNYFIIVHFSEKVNPSDLTISIEDDFNDESGSWLGSGDRALSIVNTAKQQSFLKLKIPKKLAKKKFTHTLNNGILEVIFER